MFPLVGNAIVLGSDEDGDICDCKSKPEDLLGKLIWGNKETAEMYRNHAMRQPMVITSFDNFGE